MSVKDKTVKRTVKTLPFEEAMRQLSFPDEERNLFSSMRWLDVVKKTYNLKLYVKYVEEEMMVKSYIIYSVVHNFLEWKICICSYCDYFDCYVNNSEDWKLYFHALREEYPNYRITVRNLNDESVRESGVFQELSRERFHYVDVRGSISEVWKNTHSSFRAAVKQGEKGGLVARPCTEEELKKFFKMHFNVRKNKYRLFPQPYRFFKNIWDAYVPQGNGVLLGAFDKDGAMVGANFYLICGDTLYYKFNTSDQKALKLRPNNFLFWEGLKLAKERNLFYVDLGSSGYNQDGLILFKNHTGAIMKDIVHLGFAPENYKFSEKKILRYMTKFFTMPWTPDWLVRIGSNIIYHYLA